MLGFWHEFFSALVVINFVEAENHHFGDTLVPGRRAPAEYRSGKCRFSAGNDYEIHIEEPKEDQGERGTVS